MEYMVICLENVVSKSGCLGKGHKMKDHLQVGTDIMCWSTVYYTHLTAPFHEECFHSL